MTILTWACVSLLALLALGQWPAVWAFACMLRRAGKTPPDVSYRPKVAVILCLRGADPFLRQCIERLLQQDYPNYELVIVVDSRQDPAWSVVEQVLQHQRPPVPVRMEPLREHYHTCALKCSSLVQAVGSLDPSVEVVALLDADTLPHPTWLSELVAPLADPKVPVASGNRWYMPGRANIGSLVRYVWNAGAVVQMYWNRFTWGGSVALRSDLFRCPELLERWRTSVSSDTVIYDVVRRLGLQTAFVPSLLMINRESCSLGQFFRWVKRQLVVGRLYHPGWPIVLAHGLGTTLALIGAVALLVYALWAGQWIDAGILAGGLLGYLLAMAAALVVLESAARHVAHCRGEAVSWITPTTLIKFIYVLPLTQLLYAASLIAVLRLRTVVWRQIQYDIGPDRSVRIRQYQPFRSQAEPADDSSL